MELERHSSLLNCTIYMIHFLLRYIVFYNYMYMYMYIHNIDVPVRNFLCVLMIHKVIQGGTFCIFNGDKIVHNVDNPSLREKRMAVRGLCTFSYMEKEVIDLT